MTYESLEKRDFSLLDDLVKPTAVQANNINNNNQQATA